MEAGVGPFRTFFYFLRYRMHHPHRVTSSPERFFSPQLPKGEKEVQLAESVSNTDEWCAWKGGGGLTCLAEGRAAFGAERERAGRAWRHPK